MSTSLRQGPSTSIVVGQKQATRTPPGANAAVHAAKASFGFGICCSAKQVKTAVSGGTPNGTVEASPAISFTRSLHKGNGIDFQTALRYDNNA